MVGLSLLLFTQQSWADSSCFNVGFVTKITSDKKDKKSIAGDIKSIAVIYDYAASQVSGTITWNKVPTSKLITRLTIGDISKDPRCNGRFENYLMTGWTKRFKADPESFYYDFDKSSYGRIKVLSSQKDSLDFIWTQASEYVGKAMTQLCVAVSTNQIGTSYNNTINCVGNFGSFACQGPGYIEAWNEIDFVQNFAFQKGREVDAWTCRYPLGQVPGT